MSLDPAHKPAQSADRDLKRWVRQLTQRLKSVLDADEEERVEDADLAQDLAFEVKPYVDRRCALMRLLHPIDRIVAKKDQIDDLQSEIESELEEVRSLQTAVDDIDPALLSDLEAEIGAVHKDRKLAPAPPDRPPVDPPASRSAPQNNGHLLDLPIAQRLAEILGRRFITPQRLGELLNAPLAPKELDRFDRALEKVWLQAFASADLQPHLDNNRLTALRETFIDYALLPRVAALDGPEPIPCDLAALRQMFPGFFLNTPERALWYPQLPFYRATVDRPHWALVDRQYLNCTFKKPAIRLLMYARANDLPAQLVVQKSVVEDVYDRVIIETNLGETFFDNCNNLTRTVYQHPDESIKKQVYVYAKDGTIRISGKRGIPHWRPGKPRWPGVLPAVHFDL